MVLIKPAININFLAESDTTFPFHPSLGQPCSFSSSPLGSLRLRIDGGLPRRSFGGGLLLVVNGKESEVIGTLRGFGLCSYEARMYFSLLVLGEAKISRISKKASVPQSKAMMFWTA